MRRLGNLEQGRGKVALVLIGLAALLTVSPVRLALGGQGSFTTAVADRVFQQIVLDPTANHVAYAVGSDTNHTPYVFKSFDGGQTWASASNGLGSFDVFAAAISRSNPQVVYIGGYNTVSRVDAVYQSTNAGATWVQVAPNLGDLSVQALAVDPSTERTVYLGTNHGIYKSTDGGTTFSVLATMATRNVHALAIDRSTAQTLYAGTDPSTDPGVWKSADGGSTWSQISGGLPGSSGVFVLALDPTSSGTIYAGVGSSPYSLWKTTNTGQTWQQLGNTDPIYTIAVDPLSSSNVYYTSQNSLFRSDNGGVSFAIIYNKGGGPVQVDSASPQTIYEGGQGVTTFTSGPPIIATVTATPPVAGTPGPSATPGSCTIPPATSGSGQSYTFPQTGHTVSGIWLDFVKSHGDVDNLGYPRSEVICDPITGQTVQYFQRVVLEYHPQNAAPYQIQRRLLVSTVSSTTADPPADQNAPPPGDAFYFPAGAHGYGHFVANFTSSNQPTYFKQYFDSHGREDTFGYPLEEPKQRTGADGVQRWTQRFQAAVFEYHPENDVAGNNANGIPLRTYRVQLELLGDEYIAKNNLGLK